MEKYDLTPYYTTFKIVVYMAEQREKEYAERFAEKDIDGDGIMELNLCSFDIEELSVRGKEKELYDFLNCLDYELVKTLQVIMYIGRDGSFIEKDGTYNYKNSRKYMDERGWHEDKSIEVNQMVEKIHLAEYLKEGFRKLNIVL